MFFSHHRGVGAAVPVSQRFFLRTRKEGIQTGEDLKRFHQLKNEGKCCASILVQLGLDLKEEENDQLVQAVSGLCLGMKSGLVCGALTGGACMLTLFDENSDEMVQELAEWFRAVYGEKYGGIDCTDITLDDPHRRQMECPDLIQATYLQAKRILSDYGYLSRDFCEDRNDF